MLREQREAWSGPIDRLPGDRSVIDAQAWLGRSVGTVAASYEGFMVWRRSPTGI